MKSKLLVASFVVAATLTGCVNDRGLGPLTNFYYDCNGSHGSRQKYVREILRRALAGDSTALQTVFTDQANFGTGDNEAHTELPGVFLRALGDTRYAAFVASQPPAVQITALRLYPEQIPNFFRAYPKTVKLFRADQAHTSRNT